MSCDVGSIDLERETSQTETKTLKKSNKITLCNQKLIHEKYDNLKVDSDTIKKQLYHDQPNKHLCLFKQRSGGDRSMSRKTFPKSLT